MVKTASTMLPLGTNAPNFTLLDPDGTPYTLCERPIESGLLVMFICNHCPFVKYIAAPLAAACRNYQDMGIEVVAINSNDFVTYPDDAPPLMNEASIEYRFSFPYLVDEDQSVAKAYHAACTPDLYLFDKDKQLFYRGQFDDARPGNDKPITGIDLSAAVQSLIGGLPAPEKQTPSIGCNIKWKPGNEPDYFG